MIFHIENDQVVLKVFNHGNITIKTTSGEIVKLPSKEFWQHIFWEQEGDTDPFILELYDKDCNIVDRHEVLPQNMLGDHRIRSTWYSPTKGANENPGRM